MKTTTKARGGLLGARGAARAEGTQLKALGKSARALGRTEGVAKTAAKGAKGLTTGAAKGAKGLTTGLTTGVTKGAKGAAKGAKTQGKALGIGARGTKAGARLGANAREFLDAATEPQRERHGRARLLGGLALGAGIMYLLDPADGRRRRHVTRDKVMKTMRRRRADARKQAQYAAGQAQGARIEAEKAQGIRHEQTDLDDTTLARKVETVIFRDAAAPKGKVAVNAEHGVVYLRGEVEQADWIERLGEQARGVEGVTQVKNLLHAPGTPAPTK